MSLTPAPTWLCPSSPRRAQTGFAMRPPRPTEPRQGHMPARRMRWRSPQPSSRRSSLSIPSTSPPAWQRMMQSLEQGHFQEARNDLDLVLNYPNLIADLRKNPQVFRFLYLAAQRFARYGLIAEALRIADMAVSCSIELNQSRGLSHLLQGNGPQRRRPIGLDPGRSRRQAASTGDPCQRPIQRVVPVRQALRSGPDADQRGARSVAGDQPEKGQQDGSRISDGRWQMTEGR